MTSLPALPKYSGYIAAFLLLRGCLYYPLGIYIAKVLAGWAMIVGTGLIGFWCLGTGRPIVMALGVFAILCIE